MREKAGPQTAVKKTSYPHGHSVSATWKEAKESSVKSFTKRSIPLACSSVIKAKMTSWVPSSGISVNVDLASLRSQRKNKKNATVDPNHHRESLFCILLLTHFGK